MPDRTTKVTLTANISQYIQGMELAAAKTRTLGDAAAKIAQQRQAFTDVGRVIFAVGALAAAGVALAIKEFADFDAKMAQVKTLSGATAEEMNKLSDAALHLGQSIGFTANDVADAEIELVKAGISVQDQLGGALQGALQLAAAGQIDVAQATEIATIAMTQFALKGKDVPHVADLLAAGADKALGSVGDLGEALKSGGLVAAQFGVSLDETVGTLSAFANAGLIGETAGTDLRQMLLKLANPAADAQAALDDLGISIYDQGGKFVGLSNLAGQLKDKLGEKSEADRNAALATIFGSRAIAGANVLYKEGAAGIAKWTDEVDTSGFAAKQAAGKMDNLNGDLTKLKAAFQTSLIEAGSGANDVLRTLVQGLTGLTSLVGDLPQPVITVGLAVAGLVAVLGLTGGAALMAVPKIAQFKQGLEALQISARGTSLAVGGITAGLSLGLVIFGIWAQKVASDQAAADAFRDSLDQTTGALTKYSRSLVVTQLETNNVYDAALKAGVSQKDLTDAVIEGGGALDKVKATLLEYSKGLGGTDAKAANAGSSVSVLGERVDNVRAAVVKGTEEFKNQQAAMADGEDITYSAADAYKDAASQVQALDDDMTSLIDTINKANGVGQDAVSTNAAYQQGIADLTDYVKKAHQGVDGYSLGVDENTAAGSKNVAMLGDLAKKNEDAAKAQFDLDGNTTNYIATLTAGRQTVIDNAIALGATADQAQAIADKVAGIPTQKEIEVLLQAQTDQATKELDQWIKDHALNYIDVAPRLRDGRNLSGVSANGNLFDGGRAQAFASGGFPTGIYSGGTPIYKFAEPETKWEAFISGRAGEETRNRKIWAQAGMRLGMYGGGGNGGGGATSHTTTIPVNIKVEGESDPSVFAALAGQGVAARLRGVR